MGENMRKVLVLSFCLLFALTSIAFARNVSVEEKQIRIKPVESLIDLDLPLEMQGLHATAQAETFILGEWTFDTFGACDEMGWSRADLTAQDTCYWHIDDFAGLGGGSYGLLYSMEGLQSLWCGARPAPTILFLCGYAALPGYGNGWDQSWVSKCWEVPLDEELHWSYLVKWDSEPGYDATESQYATKGSCDSLGHIDNIAASDWQTLSYYDGFSGEIAVIDTVPIGHAGSVKLRFWFLSDGAWSDQDGLWDTDGAFIADSSTVQASGGWVYDYEDFEDESVGDMATTDGDWECQTLTGFSAEGTATVDGFFGSLYPGLTLVQEDPCRTELTCVWAWINGSTETYACGGYPGQLAVPKQNQRGQYISEEIWSPLMDYDMGGVASGGVAQLVFDVYRDLTIPGLVFYVWHVRSWVGGCPGIWRDRNFVYYGANKDWFRGTQNFGDLIDPGIEDLQVALGVVDMCGFWYILYGDCACHSHSPLMDNVLVRRISTTGPQFSVRDIDQFQDVFPTNGTLVGTGPIDMALDVAPQANPNLILAGDSATITVSDAVVGLGVNPYGSPAWPGASVYAVLHIHRDNLHGHFFNAAAAVADINRWPLVDSFHVGGMTPKYLFRMDTAFTEPGGPRTGAVPDRFCIDFNDNYFTNGDTINFFYAAMNTAGEWSYWSPGSGTTPNRKDAGNRFNTGEMQILPSNYGAEILYVDNFSGRGAQPYFDSAFEMLGIMEDVDRYDKRGPSSCVSNSLGSPNQVPSVLGQLIPQYRHILWNSGDLSAGTMGDGTGTPEKADDFTAITTFLSQHTHPDGAGFYYSGDDGSNEWAGLGGASATAFINVYIPHTSVTGNHAVAHGISPTVVAEIGGMFDDPIDGLDVMVAYGGCPIINDFDQMQPTGISTLEMTYNGTTVPTDGAVIQASQLNDLGNPISVVLSGFSYHYIRDDGPQDVPDRVDHLKDILRHFLTIVPDPVGAGGPQFANRLAQNYPNPFNPSTTIEYSIKERAHVSLKIYNVAGQLVRTLVNKDQIPTAEGFTARWNGRNDAGTPVSSGVYFYKLVTKNFTQTKKMVLLK
jgi:hypothetical protein